MKIAGILFESLTKTGGYEVFTYNLFRTFAARGHQAVLYLPSRELRKRKAFYAGLPFETRALTPWTNFLFKHAPGILNALVAREQLRRRHHVWQIMGAYPEGAAAAGLRGRVPLVLRAHGDDIHCHAASGFGLRLDPRKDQAIRQAVMGSDKVVAMTPSVADALRALGVPGERVVAIPNGVDAKRFGLPRDRASIRARWGLDSRTPVLLTVGRNHPVKAFGLIPEAAAELTAQGKQFVWLVLGRDTAGLLPSIHEHGLEHSVRVAGPIGPSPTAPGEPLLLPAEDLVDVFAMADIFVLPSRSEAFPRVLIEAMAAGLAVVTTDAPGCRDVVEEGRYGRMAKVDDASDLARQAAVLLDDPGERTRLAEQGREHARHHDWDEIAAKYEAVYEELIRQGR